MSMRQMSRFLLSSSQPNTLRILAQNSMKRPIFVKDLLDDLGGGELLDSDTAKRLSGVSLWCSRPRKRWKTTGAKTRGYIAAAPFVIQRVEREHRDLFLLSIIHKKFNWKLGDCLVCAGCIAPLAWLPRLTLAR
jgi:hypothetical protein